MGLFLAMPQRRRYQRGSGALIDQLNPVPGYRGAVDEAERRLWRSDACRVATWVAGLHPEPFARYLLPRDDLALLWRTPHNAYPADRLHHGEDWQLIDFMDKPGPGVSS